MTSILASIQALAAGHPLPAAAALAAAVALAVLGWLVGRSAIRALRKSARARQPSAADVLTLAVAGLATALAVTGMYRFFGARLHDSGAERALFCGVLELAALAEAVRAKRSMAEHGSAGIDGAAMWALAALSGVLSAWAAGSLAAAAFRVSMPLVATWLWHRGLALERRRSGGSAIAWRVTPERVLVRLGLADPSGRTTGEAAAQRRLSILARAAKQVRVCDRAGTQGWRRRRAERRLDAALTRAVEYAGLAADPARQAALLAQMGALYGARKLADLDLPAPWAAPARPALPARPVTPRPRPGGPRPRKPAGSRFATDARVSSLTKAVGILESEPDILTPALAVRLGLQDRRTRDIRRQAEALIADAGNGNGSLGGNGNETGSGNGSRTATAVPELPDGNGNDSGREAAA
jgi:hypothetical protein